MGKANIYIDGNNLYRGAKELGFDIDYKKFRGWLRQKYNPQNIYLFIGQRLKKSRLSEIWQTNNTDL